MALEIIIIVGVYSEANKGTFTVRIEWEEGEGEGKTEFLSVNL